MMNKYSDVEWIQQLKQDTPEAKNELWMGLFKRAIAYARFRQIDNDLARDAAVEAYLRIMNKGIYQFRFQSPFCGYCRRILVNEINRSLKRAGRQPFTEEFGDGPENDLGVEDEAPPAPWEEIQKRIQKCIDNLPTQLREVINMLYFKGLGPEQTADELGITRNYVNVLAHRGRINLRICFKNSGFDTEGDLLSL